jgi:hypothetical protein
MFIYLIQLSVPGAMPFSPGEACTLRIVPNREYYFLVTREGGKEGKTDNKVKKGKDSKKERACDSEDFARITAALFYAYS